MSKKQREEILDLLSISCEFGEGWVTAAEIDENGLANAMHLGVSRALSALKVPPDEEIILDGKVNYVAPAFTNVKCLIDADVLIPLVSAAGIYAKVQRDSYMTRLKKLHPAYGFENHVGYGTTAHRSAIAEHGILGGIHRMSFKPIEILAGDHG